MVWPFEDRRGGDHRILERLAMGRIDDHLDIGHHPEIDPRRVDIGAVAGDDARLLQRLDAVPARRLGQADALRQRGVGAAPVELERAEDFLVDPVHYAFLQVRRLRNIVPAECVFGVICSNRWAKKGPVSEQWSSRATLGSRRRTGFMTASEGL
jgi:hypothetical protein